MYYTKIHLHLPGPLHMTPRESARERSSSEPTAIPQPHLHSVPSDTIICPSTHPAPNTHTGPSGLNPSFHQLMHYFMCPPLLFHQQSLAFHLCGHPSTHFVDPPVRQPPDPPPALASWHWSLGVLCAPLEQPCWALPPLITGCMLPHILMRHFRRYSH